MPKYSTGDVSRPAASSIQVTNSSRTSSGGGRSVRAARVRLASVVLFALGAGACAAHLPPASRPFDRTLTINAHRLKLHFANGESSRKGPLLVYTTGDGGWVRKDLALYRQIVSWGYPTAGFSAPDYLEHLRGAEGTTTPAALGRDYAEIIAFAETNLHVERGTPVVLIGVSRGAGLEVIAAGQPRVREQLSGVVAVALTKEEEYVRWFGRRLPLVRRPSTRVMLEVYEYLPLLGNLPLAVVQSTKDQFLPASAAAKLFGADTPTRRFRAIEARNHSFGGAREQMYQACKEALTWILARAP
ncbi:MAG: hypothetical protein V7647_3400 [Acidobacteriota bacterium]|jgi:fermentation-respiration switch protein FrsA (DUF1100 family)